VRKERRNAFETFGAHAGTRPDLLFGTLVTH
jgi:hypothetical protein